MILNAGLDRACTTSANFGAAGMFRQFVNFAAFGTGSAAPNVTDTNLTAAVGARSNSNGGFADSENAGVDALNQLMWHEVTFTRVFDIANNVNAAEWGLAPASNPAIGDLSVRDLFRVDPNDPGSLPITLTLEAGDQLQLVVTLRIQADWAYVSKSFVIAGTAGNDAAGTHMGNASFSSGASATLANIKNALSVGWPGGPATAYDRFNYYFSDQSAVAVDGNLATQDGYVAMTAPIAYVPGNFYQDWVGVFNPSSANGDHYAWLAGWASLGYRFILANPDKLTKTSLYRLTLTLRKSIGRL